MDTKFCPIWVGDTKSKCCRDCHSRNAGDRRAERCEHYWMMVVRAAEAGLPVHNEPNQSFFVHLRGKQRDDRKVYLRFDNSDLAMGKEDFCYCRITGEGQTTGVGSYRAKPECAPSGARLQPYVDLICQRVIGAILRWP